MSNRKQSSQAKPLFVADRIKANHQANSSANEYHSWEHYMDSQPVILGGPNVTSFSLDLLALSYRDHGVTHWETWKHATERGVTVDRALGVEVMSAKQPADSLWGFTVYPMAPIAKPATKPASAKPKAIAKRLKPMASPKPLPPIKRKAKLGKMFSYQAEYEAALARSKAGKVLKVTGQSSKETWMANRLPCSLAAMGISRKRQAESWNNYIKINPKCGLTEFDMTMIDTIAEVTKANALYDGLANDRSTKEKRPRYLKSAA